MGGGSSKQEVKGKAPQGPGPASKPEVDHDAFANYGVKKAPVIENGGASPVKSTSSKSMVPPSRGSEDEMDDRRPAAIAK